VNPREIFFAALERQQVPRVPFVETSIAFGIGEKLLGRKLTPVTIPQLGIKMRNVEDEKELARLLYRDDICFRFTAPTFSAKTVGKDGQSFAGEGLIKSMDDFKSKFFLPDPEDDSMYEPVKPFIEKKEEFPVICSMRLGFLSALISPKAFRQLVVGYHDRAHREISTPWILHTDGVITPIIEDILSMGIDAIHPIDPNCMDIRMFKRDYGDRVCIIGNVDINTLTMGSTDDVYQETRDLIRDLAPGYGYIVSAGNSIPEYVNSENVLAMSRAVRDFGAYPR
jgi:hypothetical protein